MGDNKSLIKFGRQRIWLVEFGHSKSEDFIVHCEAVVFSDLNTVSASQLVDRFINYYPEYAENKAFLLEVVSAQWKCASSVIECRDKIEIHIPLKWFDLDFSRDLWIECYGFELEWDEEEFGKHRIEPGDKVYSIYDDELGNYIWTLNKRAVKTVDPDNPGDEELFEFDVVG